MHTLYCKGWQGPATRESDSHRPLDNADPMSKMNGGGGGAFALRAGG